MELWKMSTWEKEDLNMSDMKRTHLKHVISEKEHPEKEAYGNVQFRTRNDEQIVLKSDFWRQKSLFENLLETDESEKDQYEKDNFVRAQIN